MSTWMMAFFVTLLALIFMLIYASHLHDELGRAWDQYSEMDTARRALMDTIISQNDQIKLFQAVCEERGLEVGKLIINYWDMAEDLKKDFRNAMYTQSPDLFSHVSYGTAMNSPSTRSRPTYMMGGDCEHHA